MSIHMKIMKSAFWDNNELEKSSTCEKSTYRQTAKARASLSNLARTYAICTNIMRHVMRKLVYALWEQQRCRSACASAQSHPAFVVQSLDSLLSLLSKSKVSTQKTGFLVMWLI